MHATTVRRLRQEARVHQIGINVSQQNIESYERIANTLELARNVYPDDSLIREECDRITRLKRELEDTIVDHQRQIRHIHDAFEAEGVTL